jgi:phosphoribosyl-AMP cyclohydrolase / phosphoribosyl-ATP pyrophosphohydrolase
MIDLDALDFAKGGGLVTVVAQDAESGAVLMVAHADREALERTLATGEMHYRSRTRGAWHKGATSGNVQKLVVLLKDCDGDAILARIRPKGPACHTGAQSCFLSQQGDTGDAISALDAVIASRMLDVSDRPSYTATLAADRNLRLKKLGEEAAELAVACADGEREQAIAEGADLLYHMLVALRAVGAGAADLRHELARRAAR